MDISLFLSVHFRRVSHMQEEEGNQILLLFSLDAFLFQFSSFVVYVRTHTHTYSLSLLYKDDLHVLHGVAEQQRSIEDGVVCDSHEIVSEIFERLDHGYVFVSVVCLVS